MYNRDACALELGMHGECQGTASGSFVAESEKATPLQERLGRMVFSSGENRAAVSVSTPWESQGSGDSLLIKALITPQNPDS